MFTTIIVQPIFNLLALIYALLPGHNFGLSIIIFTVLIRLAMWPLVRKQLRQAKVMRELQPEVRKIKQKTKGDRTKESAMLMELYKERGVNPVGSIGILIPQFIILIGLYSGLRRVVNDPHSLVSFSYPFIQHLHWMTLLAQNIHRFDDTLFGFVNLTRSASGGKTGVYWPAMLIVILSAIAQYYQSKQLMPDDKTARGLRAILKDASGGKQADQSEMSAAVGRNTRYLLPVFIFFITVNLPAALSLYWLTGGVVAFIQQGIALREDETDMEKLADAPTRDVTAIPEAEVVVTPKKVPPKSKKKSAKRKKKPVNDSMDEAIRYGKQYLEDILSFFGLNTDVYATSDEEVIQLNVPSTHLNGFLIGQRGENMRSLQYLTSTALKNNDYAHNRVNVDVAEYKKQRADRLREKAEEWVKQVGESGEPMDLQPMNAADRRVVHQLAAEYSLTSESAGEGRDRHIILKKQ